MSQLQKLVSAVWSYRIYTLWGILFHILTALFTVVSIPLVIPFFQLLFGQVDKSPLRPESIWDLEGMLNYGFGQMLNNMGQMESLKWVCVLVIIVFLLKNISRYMISFFMIPVRNGILKDLRNQVWQSFQSLSLSDRDKLQQGYLNSLITNDISEVDHGILKAFEMLFKMPLIVLGSLIFMLLLNPLLTFMAFVLILFTLLVVGQLSHNLKGHSEQAQEALSQLSTIVDRYLSALKTIRTLGLEFFYRRSFEQNNEAYYHMTNTILRRRDLASPIAEFLGVVTVVVLLYAGTTMVLDNTMQPASFFAFIFAFYNIIDPSKRFAREYANVQRGLAALDRIESFREDITVNKVLVDDTLPPTPKFERKITLEGIDLRYVDSDLILTSVDLQINKGDKIGIVGYSGAGKTSIFDVLLGFYQPTRGRVLLDDREITDFDQESYRELFSLVAQEPILFYGSVRENIILSREESPRRLFEILNQVKIPSDLLDKNVGDRGTMLSGGQRQRVCIARALYKNPSLLLLDEPTSELDAKSEAEVCRALLNVMKDQTILMISHNVALLKEMDQIWVIDQGQVVDTGTYTELLQHNALFEALI